jgi:hypothetical protein
VYYDSIYNIILRLQKYVKTKQQCQQVKDNMIEVL